MTAPTGLFTPTARQVWTLGNPDAPDLSFQGIDGYGVEWAIEDPAGWYASPPVELGLEDKPTDGSWFGRGAYLPRVLEINGAIRACGPNPADLLEDAAQRLQDCLDPRTDTLWAVNERVPKQLTVRPSAEVSVMPVTRRVRTLAFVLTAADPFKYAAGAAGLVSVPMTLLDPATVTGMSHPMVSPLNHGGAPAARGGQATVVNGGLPIAPLVTITGPVANPVVTNATTGQSFGLNYTLAPGETAVLDMDLRMVLLTGLSRLSLKAPRSQFWALAKGSNDLRFTASSFSAAASAVVTYRPRWK